MREFGGWGCVRVMGSIRRILGDVRGMGEGWGSVRWMGRVRVMEEC